MKTIKNPIFGIIAFLISVNLSAADLKNALYEKFIVHDEFSNRVSWIPDHILESLDLTHKLILRQEDKIDSLKGGFKCQVASDDSEHSYGSNSADLDKIRESALIAIRDDFKRTGVRPRVLEIGPGHGFFSENIIVAGGNLTAVELQEAALAIASKNVSTNVSEYLREGEEVSSLFTGVKGDITDPKAQIGEGKFKFIVAINVVNFLTPTQMDAFIELAWNRLEEGGQIFISGPSPSSLGQNLYYAGGVKDQKKYPGFMMFEPRKVNSPSYRCSLPGDKLPGVIYGGRHYGDEEWQVRHLFTPATLTELLTAKGFVVEDAYYRDADNKKIPPKTVVHYATQYTSCIIARMPVMAKAL